MVRTGGWLKSLVAVARSPYFLAILSFAALAAFLLTHYNLISPDASMHLDMARMVLRGNVPYIDFIDSLPPSMVIVYLFPALITLALPSPLILSMFVLALCIASAVCCVHLLKMANVSDDLKATGFFAWGCAVAHLLFLFQFGNHEHLLFIFLAPYIITRYLSVNQMHVERRLACLLGVLAGLAFTLHLIYPVVFLFVELSLAGKRYSARAAEVFCCLATMATIYILLSANSALSWGFYLSMSAEIFNLLNIDDGVCYLSCSPNQNYFLYLCFLSYILAFVYRERLPLLRPFFVVSLAGLVLFIFQKNGETDDLVLAASSAIVVIALCMAPLFDQLVDSLPDRISAWAVRSAMLAVCLALAGWWIISSLTAGRLLRFYTDETLKIDNEPPTFVSLIKKNSNPGDRILILNDTQSPSYPILFINHRRPCKPLTWGFQIRSLVTRPEEAKYLDGVEKKFLADLKRVLRTKAVTMLFIQQGRTGDWIEGNEQIKELIDENFDWLDEAWYGDKDRPYYGGGCWFRYGAWRKKEGGSAN